MSKKEGIFKRILKKTNKNMISEEDLISYKQSFTGQEFQWIKTDRPELLGKVVKCREVDIIGNRIVAIFDDGSKCDVNQVNNFLLMIHENMQPLSKMEVESIYGTRVETPPSPKAPPLPGQTTKKEKPVETKQPEINPFEMFNSDTTELTLKMDIKLPDKKLLKMMYNSAEKKEEFLSQLSSYISSKINNNVVMESLQKMLDPKPAKKESNGSGSGVKLTEVTKDE